MAATRGQPAGQEVFLDRVHHIGINVADLDRSIAFYRDLFGVEPLFVNDMRGEGSRPAPACPAPTCVFA